MVTKRDGGPEGSTLRLRQYLVSHLASLAKTENHIVWLVNAILTISYCLNVVSRRTLYGGIVLCTAEEIQGKVDTLLCPPSSVLH